MVAYQFRLYQSKMDLFRHDNRYAIFRSELYEAPQSYSQYLCSEEELVSRGHRWERQISDEQAASTRYLKSGLWSLVLQRS